MRHLAGKISVGYVGGCEILLGIWFALYFSTGPRDFGSRPMSLGIPAVLMTVFLAGGIGLLFRRRWAWYLSLLLTLAFLCAGVFFLLSSTGDDYYAITKGDLFLGIGTYLLMPSLLGLVLLCVPETRLYVLHKRRRRRRRRSVDEYGREEV